MIIPRKYICNVCEKSIPDRGYPYAELRVAYILMDDDIYEYVCLVDICNKCMAKINKKAEKFKNKLSKSSI